MNLKVNGDTLSVESVATVADLIAYLGLTHLYVAVEHNRRVVSRPAWASTLVAEGDQLEVVTLVGGG